MIKQIYIALTATLFLFSQNTFAQFNLPWQQTYGFQDQSESAEAVYAFADGSAIVAVRRNTNDGGPLGNVRAEIFKLDPSGNTVWQTTLGGPGNDNLRDMIVDPNGDIVTVGLNSINGIASTDMWVVKLNSAGTILWEKRIGGSDYDQANSIIATSDGGYLTCLLYTSPSPRDQRGSRMPSSA